MDENFQHHFVINNRFYISETSQIVLPNKSIHNNRDIFYDEMVLIFLWTPLQSLI